MKPERILAYVGIDATKDLLPKLQMFSQILLVHFTARSFVFFQERGIEMYFYLSMGYLVCALASHIKRYFSIAILIAFLLASYQFSQEMPAHANHFFLEWFCLLVCSVAYPLSTASSENLQALCQTLKWVVILVFLLSGLQKFLHGTYFYGVFLARELSISWRFDAPFLAILSNEAFLLHKNAVSPGPYIFSSLPAIALSNAIWITQITFPLLILSRYKKYGLALTLLLLIGIEVVAREYMFGLLVIALLLLYIPGNALRFVRFPIIGIYILLIASRFNILHIAFN